jgi:hypothetical protein
VTTGEIGLFQKASSRFIKSMTLHQATVLPVRGNPGKTAVIGYMGVRCARVPNIHVRGS